jgi:hypothetical protein
LRASSLNVGSAHLHLIINLQSEKINHEFEAGTEIASAMKKKKKKRHLTLKIFFIYVATDLSKTPIQESK